jgi:ketosteroid isomerase-like protein
MNTTAMSRRAMLQTGSSALVAAAGVPTLARADAKSVLGSKSQAVVRNYYAAWDKKDWHLLDSLLADDFTFSSPRDDRINKGAYKAGCWDTQIAYIDRFDLTQVMGTDSEAFVMYLCHTANGKTFHNVEFFKLGDDKVKAVECYFGGDASFPSAVSTGKE